MFYFSAPWKHQNKYFVAFSGAIEIEQGFEYISVKVNITVAVGHKTNHQNIVFFKSAIKFSIFALEKHHLPNIHCKNENLLSFHIPLIQIERAILYHRIDF